MANRLLGHRGEIHDTVSSANPTSPDSPKGTPHPRRRCREAYRRQFPVACLRSVLHCRQAHVHPVNLPVFLMRVSPGEVRAYSDSPASRGLAGSESGLTHARPPECFVPPVLHISLDSS
ncbi:hypothetical protein H8E77_01610 [bacterium]|nr:hypothetical protein [bacterium]